MRSFILFFVFSFVCVHSCLAQKRIKKGSITYNVTNADTKVAELQLMKGTELVFSFNARNQKTDISLMSGLIRHQTINRLKKDEIVHLYDLLGEQHKVISKEKEALLPFYKIIEIKHKEELIKNIAGYPCHQVEITTNDGILQIWVTNKIKVQFDEFKRLFPNLEEFPLEYVVITENARLTFTAQRVSSLPANAFEIDNAYQLISKDEFIDKTGGIKFGF